MLDKYSNFAIVILLPTKEADTVGKNVRSAIERLVRESRLITVKLLTDGGGKNSLNFIKYRLQKRGIEHAGA
jgi:hypothetical protein